MLHLRVSHSALSLFWWELDNEGVVTYLINHIQVFRATDGESPSSVAYDTPSPKLLAFLKKQYGAVPFC